MTIPPYIYVPSLLYKKYLYPIILVLSLNVFIFLVNWETELSYPPPLILRWRLRVDIKGAGLNKEGGIGVGAFYSPMFHFLTIAVERE